jgi:uncharacterized protein YlxW (UPF0749 family)
MNPFASQLKNQTWIIPVTAMCFVLGLMVSLAWVTDANRKDRLNFLPIDQNKRISEATLDINAVAQLSSEVTKLRQEKTELENALADQNKGSKALNDSLQEAKMFAGLTPLEGPGVVVTLKDSPAGQADLSGVPDARTIIHDTDVLQVVNELKSSGAEAVSVNNHRIAGAASFRCVGPTILVNDVKVASPIVVRAIGDADTLMGAMNLPGGILSQIRGQDPAMVAIERVKKMSLPAFVGTTAYRAAIVPKESK